MNQSERSLMWRNKHMTIIENILDVAFLATWLLAAYVLFIS